MSIERYIITPKCVFDLEAPVIHAASEQEAARVAYEKYLETGKKWEVFQSRGTPTFDDGMIHKLVEENILLRKVAIPHE